MVLLSAGFLSLRLAMRSTLPKRWLPLNVLFSQCHVRAMAFRDPAE
jgi:hypothetical protein